MFCVLMILRLVMDTTVDSPTYVREFRDVSCYVLLSYTSH